MSTFTRKPVSLNLKHTKTCRRCGYVGVKCEFYSGRSKSGYPDLCEVCRAKESLERKRKEVAKLEHEREKILEARRAAVELKQQRLLQPDAAQRAANDY